MRPSTSVSPEPTSSPPRKSSTRIPAAGSPRSVSRTWVETVIGSTLREVPAVEERGRRPSRIRLEVLPARRPWPLAHHPLSFGPDRGRVRCREAADLDRHRELVLVLPLRLARVAGNPDVEDVVAGRDRPLAVDVRFLEVHVPAANAVRVAKDPDRVRSPAREDHHELARATGLVDERERPP